MADEPDATNAKELAALGRSVLKQTDASEERAAYIERLRKLVQAGDYHVDAEALARKIIENHRPEDDAK